MHRLVVVLMMIALTVFDHADTTVFFEPCQFHF